ncbi:MAG: HAD family phosphatase [Symploca sp. SIO2E6]|nr:HAD family phosphatase [Symploca sp. SIO2E6]
MLQAVLFDIDGTLANTDPIHFQIWQQLLQDYGLQIDRPFYRKHLSGRTNAAIAQDLLPQLSIAEGDRLGIAKEERFREFAQDQLEPMPGLLRLIDWLKLQDWKLAVVSNAPRLNAEFILQTLKLEKTFPMVIIAEDLPVGKPDPLPYQEALRRLDLAAEMAVVFEDSPSGIRSAVAAGITTIGVASTHPHSTLYDLGSTLVIDDFTDERLLKMGFFSSYTQ